MYYQLKPYKSTTMGFLVAFECLQSFLHASLNAKTCFDALQPSQSEIISSSTFSNKLAVTCEHTQVHANIKSS